MDNYAIFRMGKLKTTKDLMDSYKHNERLYRVENADPDKASENIELIDTFGVTYEELFDAEMTDLKVKGVESRTIRKDAVRGLEIILTFSKERMKDIDINEWAAENMKWIDENFNPPEHKITFKDKNTGEEKTEEVQNIKHAILHMDESKPHLHAFIVPIDDKGHLNSHYYNKGRAHLISLQNNYAKAMEKFGLERGEMHSTATPEKMSRYYNYITKAVDAELPIPKAIETKEEYYTRANETYRIALSNHRNEIVKKDQEIVHIKSQADKQIYKAKEDIKVEKELFQKVRNTFIEKQDGVTETDDIALEEKIVNAAIENEKIKKAFEDFPDEEVRDEAKALYAQLLIWQEEQEEKEKRKKQRQNEKGR